jgi:hypothetical protein
VNARFLGRSTRIEQIGKDRKGEGLRAFVETEKLRTREITAQQ